MTWADNGNQYTSWGDGEGFNSSTRASLGVAEVTGGKDNYSGRNIWTGDGKSVGILAVGNTLYLLKSRGGSGEAAYDGVELMRSTDLGRTWSKVRDLDPGGTGGLFSATFLQAGQGYRSGPQTIHVYAPRKTRADDAWEVQKPGEIVLVELDRTTLREVSRKVVFTHPEGVMRTSVIYNPQLGRYFLTTQQRSRVQAEGYRIGIYESHSPAGPWREVRFLDHPEQASSPVDPSRVCGDGQCLNHGSKTVFWNFSPKWLSNGGRDFVMVYTGPGDDNWGTIEGEFVLDGTPPSPTSPPAPSPTSPPDPSPTSPPAPSPDPGSPVSGLPLYLHQGAPEYQGTSGVATVYLEQQPGASVVLRMRVGDADHPAEGALFVNGVRAATLFGQAVGDDNTIVDLTVTASGGWRQGSNELLFVVEQTAGFVILDLTVEQ